MVTQVINYSTTWWFQIQREILFIYLNSHNPQGLSHPVWLILNQHPSSIGHLEYKDTVIDTCLIYSLLPELVKIFHKCSFFPVCKEILILQMVLLLLII